MPDTIYIALVICLVATNLTRIITAVKWISAYLSILSNEPNDRLVPLYDLEGVQIGFVRITDADYPLSSRSRSGRIFSGPNDGNEHNQTIVSRCIKSLSSSAWDGWLDTKYYTAFSSQEFTATQNLALNWSCEKMPGKEISQRCIRILVCASHSCSFDIRCAPAIRGEDLNRQLTKKCFCGQKLHLQSCGVESTTYIFRGGAHFINLGTHTHSKYTHTLSYCKHQPLEIDKFFSKYDQLQRNTATPAESSSGSDSEEEKATVNPGREQSRSSSSHPAVTSENEVGDALFIRNESDETLDPEDEWEKDNDPQAAESE
ncbi:hypothetical protein R3P38DRAFT_3327553 [Favolaschia claudopus]|uniref:Uncharacterized protein n=1 Tax=Favolaschia claudopus TaxID=2862362 RepID=A0AAW0A4K2_9AGAR